MEQQTPVAETHKQLGAKLIPFAGWNMPLHYGSVLAEHKAVREQAGVFDVSHMCVFEFKNQTLAEKIFSIDFSTLKKGEARYGLILTDNGGVLEDGIVYNVDGKIWACTNAANHSQVSEWIAKQSNDKTDYKDHSGQVGILAIQGPETVKVLKKLLGPKNFLEAVELEFMQVSSQLPLLECFGPLEKQPCFIARSGYTGEQGFEFFVPAGKAKALFDSIVQAGTKPVGLGARDTLRLEACFHLHGSDMNGEKNPFEVGLGWSIPKEGRGFYIGKNALEKLTAEDKKKQLIAFTLEERGIPRSGMEIYSEKNSGRPMGIVTSGGFLPTIGKGGGLALLDKGSSLEMNELFKISIRGKLFDAKRCKLPLYPSKAKETLKY